MIGLYTIIHSVLAKYIVTIRSTTCKLQSKQRFQSENKMGAGGRGKKRLSRSYAPSR